MSTPPSARHAWYTRPETAPLRLQLPPRLASWDAKTSPSQQQLAAYLAATEDLLGPELAGLTGPWSLRLDVGVPRGPDLLEAADLDNYAYPVTSHLTRSGALAPAGLMSVWCTKQYAESSSIRVAPATAATMTHQQVVFLTRTTASATTAAFKEQVQEGVREAAQLPEGPVRVEVSYVVGERNWINLWKPTIDALDPVLGRTVANRRWHPRDGRITELAMHLSVDLSLRYDVELCILAEPARQT